MVSRQDSALADPVAIGITVIAICALLPGCGPTPPSDVAWLHGQYISSQPLTILPGELWNWAPDGGPSFKKVTTLLCRINTEDLGGLVFILEAQEETARFHFMISWDGKPMWSEPRTLGAKPMRLIPPERDLFRGLHHLNIERINALDEKQDRRIQVNRFKAIKVELNGEQIPILFAPTGTSFLDNEMANVHNTHLAGCLMHGSGTIEGKVKLKTRSVLNFTAANVSSAPATFSVLVDGEMTQIKVAARCLIPVKVPIPAGRHNLRFEAQGIDNGYYLWGAPYLHDVSPDDRPTIVVITLDTTRKDAIYPYNNTPEVTPNLGNFAMDATLFDRAVATAPWTVPTHASIFTGRFPSEHRAGVLDDCLSTQWLTMTEHLRDLGYYTAGFAGGAMAGTKFGFGQGFLTFRDPGYTEIKGDQLTDEVIDLLEKHHDKPLFLFVNYFDAHEEYKAPLEYRKRLRVGQKKKELSDIAVWQDFANGNGAAWQKIRSEMVPPSPEGNAYLRSIYLAEVAFMDHQIGRLFDALKRHGLYDDALIIVVADHGEMLGEKGHYSHSCRLEPELIDIPLIIKWPGQQKASRVSDLVSQVDLYPTVLALVNPHGNRESSGITLTSTGPEGSPQREAFMEEHVSRYHILEGNLRIAEHLYGKEVGDSRTVFWNGGINCVRRDNDLWTELPCTSTWQSQLELLPPAFKTSASHSTTATVADLSEDEAERLRALGYLQ